MKKKLLFNEKVLNVKEKPLPKVKSNYHIAVSAANKRISDSINSNKIEEGNSIEKARAFVTNV